MAFGGLKGTLTGNGNSVTASNSLSGSVSVVVGDLVFVAFGQQTALTATAATDNLGNSYTAQNAGTDAGTSTGRAFYSVVTVAGTLTSVAVAATASANDYAGLVAVIEGPFTAIDTNPANAADITSPFNCPSTGTLAQPTEVVMAWGTAPQSTVWAATSPNLLASNVANASNIKVAIGYQAVSATTAVIPVFTAAANPADDTLGTASFKGVVLKTLTGVAGTGSAGTMTAIGDANVSLTGVAGTGSAGTATANVGGTLTGVSATGSPGSFTETIDKTLTGAQGSGSAGTIAGAIDKALTGVSASGGAGTCTSKVDFTLVGAQASGTAGEFTFQISANVSVTGVSATGTAGLLTDQAIAFLIGASATGAAQSTAIDIVKPLTGVSAAGSAGSFTTSVTCGMSGCQGVGNAGLDINIAVPGVAATGNVGTITCQMTVAGEQNVDGVAAVGSAGILTTTVDIDVALTGVSATGEADDFALELSASIADVFAAGSAGDITIIFGVPSSIVLPGASAHGIAGECAGVGNVLSRNIPGVYATGIAKDLGLYIRSRGLYPPYRTALASTDSGGFPPQWWYGFFD